MVRIDNPRYVSEEECARMNALRDDGLSYSEIEDIVGRHETTIRRHVLSQCKHISKRPKSGDYPSKSALARDLRRLADRLGHIPSTVEWNHWDEAECSHTYLISTFDGWKNALESAGLAPLSPRTPLTIRREAYLHPEIAESRIGGSSG